MKTKISKKVKNVLFISIVLLIGISCANKQQNKSENKKSTEVSVKTPGTDIHTAAFMGDVNTIKQHIAAGTDLNAKDQYGSTPLIIAATFGKTEAAIALIEGKADLNLKNGEGSTPLNVSAFFCRPEIVKALLEHGADKSIKNNYGATPLESVSAPFNDVKAIYEQVAKQLGPLGLKFDFEYIEKTRPEIAEMLK